MDCLIQRVLNTNAVQTCMLISMNQDLNISGSDIFETMMQRRPAKLAIEVSSLGLTPLLSMKLVGLVVGRYIEYVNFC